MSETIEEQIAWAREQIAEYKEDIRAKLSPWAGISGRQVDMWTDELHRLLREQALTNHGEES